MPFIEVRFPLGCRSGGDSGAIRTMLEIAGLVSSTQPVRDATSRKMTIPGADPKGQSAVAVTQSAGTDICALSNAMGTQPDGVVPWSTADVRVGRVPGVEGVAVVPLFPQAADKTLTVTRQSSTRTSDIGNLLLIG